MADIAWHRVLTSALAFALGFVPACSSGGGGNGPTADVDRTCSGAQALVAAPYNGSSLGSKQLALTFDDGPASRTLELSAYLAAQGIHAGFFINGKNLPAYPAVLAGVVADGHVIGNHTQDHFDLSDRTAFPVNAAGNAKLVTELTATDTLIAPFVPSGRFMFRAPYGAFDARDYGVLQASPMKKYVGHVSWDVGGTRTATTAADWACWENNPQLTTKACGDLYLNEITAVGRGVVLMHDADYGNSANHSLTSGVGNSVDMVKYLVPILKARGYTFVRVDSVPAIASALPPLVASDAGADSGGETDASSGGSSSHPGGGTSPDSTKTPASGAVTEPGPPATDPCAHVAPPADPPRTPDAH